VDVSALLLDCLGRVRDQVPDVVEGLDDDALAWRPDAQANSLAWLVWHLTRVLDDHVADAAGRRQVWTDGWSDRFGLPLPPDDHGFGHGPEQVAAVRVAPELLVGYHRAVAAEVERFVTGLTEADLDRVVDRRWDPPVTLGVRLVSVVCETNQHLGQAAYVRGMLDRRKDLR
jgi:uncharacterized damage-inducible protein DinB